MEEEDAPPEDWTRKELVEECKALELTDKGTKAVLIATIKEARAAAPEVAIKAVEVTEEAITVADSVPAADADNPVEEMEFEDVEIPVWREVEPVAETLPVTVLGSPAPEPEEAVTEDVATEVAEPAAEIEAPTEVVTEEAAPLPTVEATVEEEEDAPLEDWTKKELAEECKTLGLSDKGARRCLLQGSRNMSRCMTLTRMTKKLRQR